MHEYVSREHYEMDLQQTYCLLSWESPQGDEHQRSFSCSARINVCIRLDDWTHKYIKALFEAVHCRTNNVLYASK